MTADSEWKRLEEQIVGCHACPRLVDWRETVAKNRRRAYSSWLYWGKPVPGFGDRFAKILVIGLAPGAHGSNRTGRMFTGDSSGDFLYRALNKAGFANQPNSTYLGDGLTLNKIFITAVCRCAPPGNKPLTTEIVSCLDFLVREIFLLNRVEVIVVLGKIAFDGVLKIFRPREKIIFKHGQIYNLGNPKPILICSYHPSRQNTQTGRLNEEMFDFIWSTANKFIS